jgi:hypothetical protein
VQEKFSGINFAKHLNKPVEAAGTSAHLATLFYFNQFPLKSFSIGEL